MEGLKNSLCVATGAFAATQLLSTGLKQQYNSVNWGNWYWSSLFSAFGGAVAAFSVQKLVKGNMGRN